ncbi:MAG: hypothetical protein KGJ59_03795 [Bacteroidota bacterium]|nr:hypothetical protein [Bacteroidota bacterium]
MRRIFFAACIVSSLPAISVGQIRDSSSVEEVSPVLESLFEGKSEKEISDVRDELDYLHQHPINVNSATLGVLAAVPFLSSHAAEKILALRDSMVNLTPADLFSIAELEPSVLEIILPCFSFEKENERGDVSLASLSAWFSGASLVARSRVVNDIQTRKGFADGEYPGSSLKKYQRIEFNTSRIAARILYEQDAGERLKDGFSSFSLGIQTPDVVKGVVIGDYSVKSGKGLALSSFGTASKLQGIISGSGRASIVPYASTDEFHYFRGIAAAFDVSPFVVHVMYSNTSRAAAVDSCGAVSSFYTAGLFRTETELQKKNAAREQMFGTLINFEFGNYGYVGALVFRTAYDKPIAGGSRSLSAFSVNSSLNFNGAVLYGEAAGNSPALNSGIAGMRIPVSRRMTLHISVRSYAAEYSNMYAFPFGERNSAGGGEGGVFAGIELRPAESLNVIGYYDEFALPSSGGFFDRGTEYFLNAAVRAHPKLKFSFQYKGKIKTRSGSLEERSQHSVTLDGAYRVQKTIVVRQRFEMNVVSYSISKIHETGKLAFSEVRYEHASLPFEVVARIVVFETDSYDSRVYEYENDVRGAFSNPPLYGSGMRWYSLATYKIGATVRISLKYSETVKSGVTAMGSGEDEIQGALDNRVTFQLDMAL